MDREDIKSRYASTVRRWFRVLADADGEPPSGLLDELAGIADEHAASRPLDGRRKARASASSAEP